MEAAAIEQTDEPRLKAPFPARSVVGFPGYVVSDDGRVWSERSAKVLRATTATTGYLYFDLRREGKSVRVFAHQAVAAAYIGERPSGFDVCHNDGNRLNNAATNLRYASRSDNLADRAQHGTDQIGDRNPAAKLTNQQAEEIRRRRATGEPLKTIAKDFDVRESTVSRIATGVRRAKGGDDGSGAIEGTVSVELAFGGKSRVAAEVWSRFGDVRNFIEPFAFSCAVLLNRPGGAGPIETVNDLNSFVANFWRAVKHDPSGVAFHADHPVIEDDLHARHRWLVTSQDAQHKLARVREDPDYFDARIAGWWCWGACCWIGTGWCDTHREASEQLPQMDTVGRLILSPPENGKRPQLCNGNTTAGPGVLAHIDAKRPRVPLSVGGYMPGVINNVDDTHRPQLADAFARGRGVNANDAESTCDRRRAWLTDWMLRLADRLRPVRVCCGHWARLRQRQHVDATRHDRRFPRPAVSKRTRLREEKPIGPYLRERQGAGRQRTVR